MKFLSTLSTGLLLTVLSLPAFAASCPKDMKRVDAALADNPSISAADMAMVKELRASGEAKHKSGDHGGSVQDLHKALHLLGVE